MGNFYTDVICKDVRFNEPNRISDIGLLEPVTRQLVKVIITDAKAHSIEFILRWIVNI